jgi:ParB/RepB/Spo0J family partition protein
MAMEKIDLVELGLDGGDGGTGARRAIPSPMSREFRRVPIEIIRVGTDRVRKEMDGKGEGEKRVYLRNSMKVLGLIHPITVTREYLLASGLRRLQEAKNLGWTEITVQFTDDTKPEALARIEYEENFSRANFTTLEEMRAKARWAKTLMASGLTQKQAAEQMRKSESYLSNTIKNVEFAHSNPGAVKYCETEDHVKKVRERHERIAREKEMLAFREALGEQRRFEIKTADFNEWAKDYRGLPFDVGSFDFPWGIGQDKFGQSSRTAPQYADSPEVFERLCETLWMYLDRLFAQAAHLIFWFSIARYSEVRDRLVGMGWEVNPHPFIWVKPTAGIVPRPGHDLRQAYEAAFICTRGGRMLSTKRNWFAGDPPDDRFHQSQKNEQMMEHLLSAFVTDSTRLLDPTCGSGVAIKIAKRLGAHSALGLELDEESAVLARAALRSNGDQNE